MTPYQSTTIRIKTIACEQHSSNSFAHNGFAFESAHEKAKPLGQSNSNLRKSVISADNKHPIVMHWFCCQKAWLDLRMHFLPALAQLNLPGPERLALRIFGVCLLPCNVFILKRVSISAGNQRVLPLAAARRFRKAGWEASSPAFDM